jgi:hypothetical protein
MCLEAMGENGGAFWMGTLKTPQMPLVREMLVKLALTKVPVSSTSHAYVRRYKGGEP